MAKSENNQGEVHDAEDSHRYEQVADEIRQMIRGGQLRPGDRLPSFIQTRSQYNVSRNTVDRAHDLLEQEGLVDRQHRRGVFVTDKQTQKRGTGLIGFVLEIADQDFELEPYWTHLMRGVSQGVQGAAGHLVILQSDAPAATWQGLSGVIFPGVVDPALLAARRNLPAVTLLAGTPDLPSVIADEAAGVRAAVQHLLFLGHRRIATVMGVSVLEDTGYTIEARRFAAYRETLREAGITPDEKWRFPMLYVDGESSTTEEAARYTMAQMLKGGWQEAGCTAILAQNDQIAAALIGVLQENGIRVPEDVSVVGFDGTEVSTYSKPQLTTVQLPLREIGRIGAELLLRQIEHGGAPDEQIVVPVQFKVRASTAPVAQR